MLDRMKALLKSKDTGVLATSADGRPLCSLMSYVTDKACDAVFMATLKSSTKFANAAENPAVSLLVDTRDSPGPGSGGEVQALTMAGLVEVVADEDEDERARRLLLERHPRLEPILRDPDSVVLRVRIESFLLLDGPARASFETNPAFSPPPRTNP